MLYIIYYLFVILIIKIIIDKMDIDYPEYPKSLNEKDFSIISNKSEFNSVILNYCKVIIY